MFIFRVFKFPKLLFFNNKRYFFNNNFSKTLVNISFAKFAGNHQKLGYTRQCELWSACKILNIPAENITLVNATLLPDDPTATWKAQIIAKQILKQVHSLDIDTIITFDRDGVSHHANHCAIFYSSISIYVANLLQEGN